jgi:hypothetical protein
MAVILGDRVTLSLTAVLVVGAVFYLWTAATTSPLTLGGNQSDYYNSLATAFLHLHVSIGAAPPGLIHLANPYDPAQNAPYQAAYHDLSLYHGRFYLDWGPTPVVVLLAPLHLLGLAASPSLTVAIFSIAGLAFALGAVRTLLDKVGGVPIWIAILAAFVLACATSVPFLLRRPAVYEEAISAGFCFTMAGLMIAVRVIAQRRASLGPLLIMSLCFGLAAGARPPLIAVALVMVPVYLGLRGTRPDRQLLAALAAPFAACVALLLAYNYARFGNPLEVGQSYNLAGYDPRTARLGRAAYVVPNLWYYLLSPPRPTILFPFLALAPPPLTYPLSASAGNPTREITGGLFAMTPLLVFAFALPWLRLRRPRALGALANPLLIAAGAGLFVLLFLSFEFFGSTERYEVDFAGVFLLAALAAWFALSAGAPGPRRKAIRVIGGVLAVWGCLTGIAISFTGYYNLLRAEHPGTWSTLQDLTSPISTGVSMLAGHPVLAEVQAPNVARISGVRLTSLGAGVESFSLPPGAQAQLTIVSPDRRQAALVAALSTAPGSSVSVQVSDASSRAHSYTLPGNGLVRVPVQLKLGINRVRLVQQAGPTSHANPAAVPQQALTVTSLTLASH